jgi:GntR family transcriptional regulator, rspAB operon transcriptional repressor
MSTSRYGLSEDEVRGKNTYSRDIYDKIFDKLLKNELVPGNIINRRAIAAELGVSVAPVLEAFLQLEMEGFIESIPRKGTIVKPIKEADVYGQLMMREAIECQAARLYCGTPIRAHRASLDALAEALERGEVDAPGHWRQELDFHGALIKLGECPVLSQEFVRVMKLGSFYRLNRILPDSDRAERTSHIALLDRLMDDDPDLAEQALRVHLRSGKAHIYR